MYTFHVVALPHTQTSHEYSACAYTAKLIKFCTMMKGLGHRVFIYGSEDNDAPCDELVTVITKEEQRRLFGSYDHRKHFFRVDWDAESAHWTLANLRTVAAMRDRIGPRDFVCLTTGTPQKPVADAFPAHQTVEYGIGYKGTFAKYRVFESYSWMQYVYGWHDGLTRGDSDGSFYDCVIPNYFDEADFPFSEDQDDYFLFLGRLVARKGAQIAVDATREVGARLLMAGQGCLHQEPGKVVSQEATFLGDHIEHVGFADRARRAELMSRARAVFMPTTYVEPFGGVSIEAMMCGVPVIATDWGAFPENIIHGVTGYRFRTLGEAVWAANNVGSLDRKQIRRYAQSNFSLDRCAQQYQAYFDQLADLWGDGWYSKRDSGVTAHNRYGRVS